MNNKLRIWLVLMVIIGSLVLLLDYYMKKDLEEGNLKVGEVNLQVEIAQTFEQKYQGLSGRDRVCENCGLIFVYDKPQRQQFVMRGMKFPLDFIFIREGKVVEIWEQVPPPAAERPAANIDSHTDANAVLEVNAGFVRKNNIKIGDKVSLDRSK